MDYSVTTRLKGVVAMTSSFHADPVLRRDRSLYKFIWVQRGTLTLVIDHVETQLAAGEIVSLTPLHRIEFGESGAEYLALLFNSDFYCIYGHDDEVSCNGLLFNGSSDVMRLKLTAGQSEALHEITDRIAAEYAVADNLREEMLRILLKQALNLFVAPERAKYYFVPQIDTKIKVSGCRSVSVYEGMELFIVSRMKREMPLSYPGPDGLIYTVYFEHNENVDAGSPLIGVCPPDQLQQIEEVVLKVQTEWQEQE